MVWAFGLHEHFDESDAGSIPDQGNMTEDNIRIADEL